MGLLEGKVALITGGARGQGRAHAITSAREGADIVLVDFHGEIATAPYALATAGDVEQTVKEIEALDRRVLPVEADVRSQAALDEAVRRGLAEFGKIDILIANAGVWSQAPFWKLTEQQWDDIMGVNLGGVWKSAKAVAPHMLERQAGSIVITSSVNGLEPGRNYAHYASAKHGVIGLMKNIALELAPYGIRCNAISPGAINTPMVNNQAGWDGFAGREGGTEADLFEAGYNFHAMKGMSFLEPETVANAALYLNSDLASAVTGVTIPVEAGHLLLTGYNRFPKK
jgi:SDR family mycofactocin-dependent oxidoreductase